jgi:RHS repeat-associated protein
VNRLLCSAEQWDSDMGLYYLRARYYNPLTGRFVSVDSEAGEGQRRYEYAAADPVDGMDPSGNEAIVEFALLQFYPGRLPFNLGFRISWCGFAGSGYLPQCGSGSGGPGGPGGHGPGGPPPPPPCTGPSCPKCWAQLKYRTRHVVELPWKPFNHALWYVQGSDGIPTILSGGPSKISGKLFLMDWIGGAKPDPKGDAQGAGISPGGDFENLQCNCVDNMENAVQHWNAYAIEYVEDGPNSNSAAKYVGSVGSLHPLSPPYARGWDVPINPPN